MKHKVQFLDELIKFNFHVNDFAVFGSGPMAANGIYTNCDIDIIVTRKLWDNLKINYHYNKEKDFVTLNDHIDAYNDWWGYDIEKLIKEADIIFGIRFVKLETVLEWKKIRNSDKDKKHIKLIEDYIRKIHK